MRPVTVYIIRHGETAENVEGIIQGQMDTDLNEQGRKQAQMVARATKDVSFTHAFTSDSRRAVDTAAAILQHHPGVTLEKSILLRERFMGALEGTKVVHGARFPPFDATVEAGDKFEGRLLKWWSENITGIAAQSGDTEEAVVLVLSHGAAISGLVRALLEGDHVARPEGVAHTRIFNTSITEIYIPQDGQMGILKRYGDLSHLLGPVVKRNVDAVDE